MRKFYDRCGDLIKQYEVPLWRIINDILWLDYIQWQSTTDKTLYQAVTLLPNSTFYRISRGFCRTFETGVACRRGRLLLRTPGPVPLGLAYVLLVETNPFFRIFRYFFRTMLFKDPSVLSRFSYNNTFLYAHFQYLAAWCPSCILPSDFLFLTISFNKFIRIDAMLSVLSRFIQLYTSKKSVTINVNLWIIDTLFPCTQILIFIIIKKSVW